MDVVRPGVDRRGPNRIIIFNNKYYLHVKTVHRKVSSQLGSTDTIHYFLYLLLGYKLSAPYLTLLIKLHITDAYRTKINQGDGRDNCRFEFKHAFEQKGPGVMIPVVMESGMRNARDWTGLLGAALSSHLYIDFSSVFTDDAAFDAKVSELVSRIGALLP